MNTSRAERAWIVDMDPLLPWPMALSMSITSGPRTSPTIARSGFCRKVRRTSRDIEIAPWPSELATRSSNSTQLGCRSVSFLSPSSRAFSTVMIRSSGPISAAMARSSVVFPARVAPATMTFEREATSAWRKSAASLLKVPLPTRSARATFSKRCRRMEMEGCAATDITAERRDPSGSWRSSSGFAESQGRELRPA